MTAERLHLVLIYANGGLPLWVAEQLALNRKRGRT